jgi:hypothetical protein
LNHELIFERLPRPFSPKQRSPNGARCPITAHYIVSFESRLLLASFHLNISPRLAAVLAHLNNPMLKFNFYQALPLLKAMPIHNLNDLAQLQDRHAVRMVLDTRHIDAAQLLAIGHSAPADRGECRDGCCADVVEDSSASEDSRCRDAILRCSESGV